MLIVVGAAVLRFWALDQGLPFVSARPDEREVLQATAGFAAGDLNPRWFTYPSLYLYVTWAWEEALLAARRLWVETPGYRTMLESALPQLIVNGRALSAAAGTATVAVLYAAGCEIGGAGLGLLASLLLAGNYLHVHDSHVLKPDVLLALGFLVTLWLLSRYASAPSRAQAAVAGLAIGLTAAIKYNGLVLFGPAYLACLLASPHKGLRRLLPNKHMTLLGTVALGVFLVTCPYLLLDFERARFMLSFNTWAVYAARPHAQPEAGSGWLETIAAFVRTRAFGYHLVVSLRRGCGLAMAVAVPLALLLPWRAPRQPFLMLAAFFCVLYYVVVGASPVHLTRYFTPLTPLLALLVAHTVLAVAALAGRPAARGAAAVVLSLVILAEPVQESIAFGRVVARTDTRVLATRWMAEHLPVGAVVAELGSGVFAIADPDLPPGIVRAPSPLPAGSFGARGVTHVLTHWHHQLVLFSQPSSQLLDALGPHLRLLTEFNPFRGAPAGAFEQEDAYYVPFYDFDGVERPGPLVRIYAYVPAP